MSLGRPAANPIMLSCTARGLREADSECARASGRQLRCVIDCREPGCRRVAWVGGYGWRVTETG
jgi:hypothetical protein